MIIEKKLPQFDLSLSDPRLFCFGYCCLVQSYVTDNYFLNNLNIECSNLIDEVSRHIEH